MRFTFFKKKKGSRLEEIINENGNEIEEDEREMIRGVFGLGETTAKTIMVPRTDVVAVPVDKDFDEIISTVIKSSHSRIPVYEGSIDNVIGFLYAKDLLPYLAKNTDSKNIRKILRPVLFVPEGKMIDDLLKELRHKKVHIAIVVDEYGGMAGIVCLEDIIEEIVGEIQDEYDNEEEEIKRISSGSYLCNARTPIHELNEELNINLPVDSGDTVGGFIFNRIGKIPDTGEKISLMGMELKIEKMVGRQIKKVRIDLKNLENETEEESKL